jgi:hypothetical protein
MIRFRTIDPAKDATPAPKPAARPAAPATVVETGDGPAEQSASVPKGADKAKGMTRKTPMRAKKPAAARPFKD